MATSKKMSYLTTPSAPPAPALDRVILIGRPIRWLLIKMLLTRSERFAIEACLTMGGEMMQDPALFNQAENKSDLHMLQRLKALLE